MASTSKADQSVTSESVVETREDWIQVDVRTSLDAGELLGVLNDPHVTGAWQEDDQVHLYWPVGRGGLDTWQDLKRALTQLGHPDVDHAVTINHLANQDWNAQWSCLVEPIRIGRVVIRPSWKEMPLGPGEIELIIDPKQAFGTGHHATTQLLIEWLQQLVRPDDRVLDVGTGSGVLAMVALRLGAAEAVGVDFDAVAVDCARDYAQVNGFDGRLTLAVGHAQARQPHETCNPTLVLANLDRQTLLTSAESLCEYAAGGARLLLSGLLVEQLAEIEAAYASRGVYVKAVRERDGWLALEATGMETCDGGLCS
ncbi:MAG: 50S ribosomal protein L11 methyltransferase [Thermomicrobiales bacterium]|nr:50S ribosomal protein L11 methyltransferase [Thermomicrobiales bacterium]